MTLTEKRVVYTTMFKYIASGAIVSALLMTIGCSTTRTTKYEWGNYETALYQHYKSPTDLGEYMAVLKLVFDNAKQKNTKVPPGFYAEYGYLLLMNNRSDEAIHYFSLEREAWPEAVSFMDKMIAVARNGNRLLPLSSKDQNPSEKKSTQSDIIQENNGTHIPEAPKFLNSDDE